LTDLFVGKLGITPKFLTPTGKPSFKSAYLRQWGEGGELLKSQRSYLIELKQGQRLLEKADWDGRWHIDLRATGTKTNRFAGAGGLNVQGLSRKCESLMSCLLPDKGNSVVSIDLSSGEPTVVAQYSKDKNYCEANFGMLGKRPFYDGNGTLQISDVYFMTASVSPTASNLMREAFSRKWDGLTFSDMWVKDEERIKSELKKSIRDGHKTGCLMILYGAGPATIVDSMFKAGYDITLKQGQQFYSTYFKTFPGIKRLAKALFRKQDREGRLQTEFGYCVYPDAEHKTLNYFIQASVSGIMHALNSKFFELCDFAHFITVIHDELLVEIPTHRLDEAHELWNQAVDWLNNRLNWTVKIRTGWKVGDSWFTAK
jgi:DNA polymerase I-like protein with 3'-5' exonuclease and polymerase domains